MSYSRGARAVSLDANHLIDASLQLSEVRLAKLPHILSVVIPDCSTITVDFTDQRCLKSCELIIA